MRARGGFTPSSFKRATEDDVNAVVARFALVRCDGSLRRGLLDDVALHAEEEENSVQSGAERDDAVRAAASMMMTCIDTLRALCIQH